MTRRRIAGKVSMRDAFRSAIPLLAVRVIWGCGSVCFCFIMFSFHNSNAVQVAVKVLAAEIFG